MANQNKSQNVAFSALLNVLLAIIIFVNAEAGKLLGIQTLSLSFSAVWPATGFSLAALLIFGFRLWPGILVGNLAYNFLHLYFASGGGLGPFGVALSISLASLAQALVGAYILRNYASSRYFSTVKDVVLFLFFGGVVTCLIASSVGVASLYVYGDLAANSISYALLTFWLGDTMGVLIFTPLLVVWSICKPEIRLGLFTKEAICMGIVFCFISFYTLQGYPLGYLFIPYGIWVAYRLSFHGATAATLLVCFVVIVPICTGAGPFILYFTADMLLIIVSFLQIIASTSLLFAAAISERNAAWQLIKKHRLDLL